MREINSDVNFAASLKHYVWRFSAAAVIPSVLTKHGPIEAPSHGWAYRSAVASASANPLGQFRRLQHGGTWAVSENPPDDLVESIHDKPQRYCPHLGIPLFLLRGMPACLARGIRKGWLESNSDVIGDVAADHPPRIPQIGMKIEIVGYRKRPIGYLDGGEAIEFEPAHLTATAMMADDIPGPLAEPECVWAKLERAQIAVAAMRLDTIIFAQNDPSPRDCISKIVIHIARGVIAGGARKIDVDAIIDGLNCIENTARQLRPKLLGSTRGDAEKWDLLSVAHFFKQCDNGHRLLKGKLDGRHEKAGC